MLLYSIKGNSLLKASQGKGKVVVVGMAKEVVEEKKIVFQTHKMPVWMIRA